MMVASGSMKNTESLLSQSLSVDKEILDTLKAMKELQQRLLDANAAMQKTDSRSTPSFGQETASTAERSMTAQPPSGKKPERSYSGSETIEAAAPVIGMRRRI